MSSRNIWAARLGKASALFGALVPTGIIIGSLAFEMAIGFSVLCWLFYAVTIKDGLTPKVIRHPLIPPFFALYAAIIISLVWNGPGIKGWGHDIVMLRFFLFTLAMIDIAQRQPISELLIRGAMFSLVFATINITIAYIFGYDLIGNPLIRYTGKLREAGRIAMISAYVAPFLIGWHLTDTTLKKKERWLIRICFVLAVTLLFQSGIRTNVIAGAVGILFILIYLRRKSISRWKMLGTIAVTAAVIWLFFDKIGSWSLHSLYDRIYFWKVSWAMWLKHPVVGVGISAWRDVYQEIARSGTIETFIAPDGSSWNAARQYHAHNLLLMLLSCTGLLGTAAFIWLFIRLLKILSAANTRYHAGMMAWPVVLLAIGLTGSNIFSSSYMAFLSFLVICIGTSPPIRA